MALKSILGSPSEGVMVGLGTAISVYLIYNSQLPSGADIRAGNPNNDDIESARKAAAYKSAGLIGLVFLVTRDLNAFIVSGAALTGVDYTAKHHNAINPTSGKLQTDNGSAAPSNVYSMPDYGNTEAM